MPLAEFVLPLDLRSVRYHLGQLLQLLGGLLLVPLAAALVGQEFLQAAIFAGLAVVSWLVGYLAARGGGGELDLRAALAVTALAYPTFALVGSLAFLPVAPPVDAFFEAMSGFTTTGLTVIDERRLPPSLLFFRAFSQWVGGAGIIVLSLLVLAGPTSAAAKLYTSEFGRQNLRGSVAATARVIAVVYAALTVAAYLALLAAGAGWFDGLLHALSLISTGGFSPFRASVGAYESVPIAVVTVVFMVIGATAFPLYYLVWRGRGSALARDAQFRLLLTLIAVSAVAFLAFYGYDARASLGAVFHVVSAATTTGYELRDPADWPDGSRLVALGLMVVGGAAGSTAGGIKLFRALILLRLSLWTVFRTLLPREAKIPLQIEGERVSDDEVRSAIALLTAYLLVAFASTLLLTLAGFPVASALFDSISALGTVGLSVGVVSDELHGWAKLVVAFDMWVGRVEILPVLVLLHPANWRRA